MVPSAWRATVTNALRAGINPLVLSQIAGHSSMRMIEQVYSHLNAGDSHEMMMRTLTADSLHKAR